MFENQRRVGLEMTKSEASAIGVPCFQAHEAGIVEEVKWYGGSPSWRVRLVEVAITRNAMPVPYLHALVMLQLRARPGEPASGSSKMRRRCEGHVGSDVHFACDGHSHS